MKHTLVLAFAAMVLPLSATTIIVENAAIGAGSILDNSGAPLASGTASLGYYSSPFDVNDPLANFVPISGGTDTIDSFFNPFGADVEGTFSISISKADAAAFAGAGSPIVVVIDSGAGEALVHQLTATFVDDGPTPVAIRYDSATGGTDLFGSQLQTATLPGGVIPEPSSLVLGAVALIAGFLRRRR